MKQGIITKTCAVAAALAMGVSLAACGGGSSADSDKGHVYFMNNSRKSWTNTSSSPKCIPKKTGVQVDVQTGASGTYDATMSSELAKSNAPTMFNISGFDQFAKYQKYCEPLQDTERTNCSPMTARPTPTPLMAIRSRCHTRLNGTASSTTRRSSTITPARITR